MNPQQENGTQIPPSSPANGQSSTTPSTPGNGQPSTTPSSPANGQPSTTPSSSPSSPSLSPTNGQSQSTSGNTINYPQCPPQIDQEPTEPIFTPINVEICPIINVKILKPKFCVQNQANTKPNFFLD